MKKHPIGVITILFLICIFSAVTLQAQGAGKQHKNPPFLINGQLPHLTKLLMQQWENPDLHLQEEQKGALLQIRKETIGGVKRLGGEIAPLENQVVQGSVAGKTPEELQPLVQKIAQLRSEATILHLQCIYKTSKILSKDQLAVLKK